MQVIVSNTITVENAPTEVVKWCDKNLIIPNPDYAKKLRMNLWVGNTPEKLSLYEKRGDNLTLPFGMLRRLPEFIPQNTTFMSDFQTAEDVNYGGADVPLYEYQEEATEAMYQGKYGILQSAAGSGKTQMGIALVKQFGKKALWLTHTLDLLRQSKARAEQYIDKRLIGTITGGKVNIGKGITFATIQTMCKLDLAQYKNEWDVIIVDECHRCAGTPTSMTQFYKVLNSLAARHKIGLSATVHRADGMIIATHALLGEIVYTVPDEAIADRVMKVGVKPIETNTTISRSCLNTDGTLNYARLVNHLCADNDRTELIVEKIVEEKESSCLILSDRLEHLESLIARLPLDMQKQAEMITGKMTSKRDKERREQAIEDMRTGKLKYLFATYALAKEGLDIPRLERLFLTTPQKDYAVITQSIGRIARVYDGKSDPIAYDFIDKIPYLVKSYKKRCTAYRKNGCYFVGGGQK